MEQELPTLSEHLGSLPVVLVDLPTLPEHLGSLPALLVDLPPLPEHLGSLPVFSVVRVVQSLVFNEVLCRSLNVMLPLFVCPLYFSEFFDLRLLITPLVSSLFFKKKFPL